MVIRCFQGNNDIAVLDQKLASLRSVRPGDVAAQTFEFLFLIGLTGDTDMQRKPCFALPATPLTDTILSIGGDCEERK